MPMLTFIREGLVRSLAPAAAIGLARMKQAGFSVPKERAGESTGRRRKQLDGHQPMGTCSGDAVPAPLPSMCSSEGTSTPLRAGSRLVGGSPEPCLGLPRVRWDSGAVPFC